MNTSPASLSPRSSAPVAARVQDLAAWPILQKLVAFDTTSRESNLALIEWVRNRLAGHGIESLLTYDDERRKANLFATVPAADGNASRGGIVLSGHTDVVPVDGQPWQTPPFEATVRDHKVHGRGTADMKGFIATVLALVPQWCAARLQRPIHLALSYDEEVGCIGVRRLLADIAARDIRPAGAIVGEPTGMEVVTAHKGRRTFRCQVRGHEAHSSLTPHGVNAVEIACEVVTYLTGIGRSYREQGRFDGAYDVPFTSVHTGVIHGGTAVNIVPRDCWFDFEIRHLPADEPREVIAEVESYAARFVPAMHAIAADTGIAIEELTGLGGMEIPDTHELVALAKHCAGTAGTTKVSFGSEAALFCAAGIPTVLCGPGDIGEAHQPDEWVSLDQLARCETFLRRLGEHCAGA